MPNVPVLILRQREPTEVRHAVPAPTAAPLRRGVALLILLVACIPAAHGGGVERLADAQQERRARSIEALIECVVCGDTNLEDSSEALVLEIRALIRRQINAGATEPQVLHLLRNQYGEVVRVATPFNLTSTLLWGIPLLGPSAGLGAAMWSSWRRSRPVPDRRGSLERRRLARLLDEC